MRSVLVVAVLLAGSHFLSAEPRVVGYERFYSEKPSYEGGAILYSELGCASCHGGSPVVTERKGPSLIDISKRVDREWARKFLVDPELMRSGSTMPKLVEELEEEEVDALLAYLASLKSDTKYPTARHANAERGSALYHEKGCVACHAPTPDFLPPHGVEGEFEQAVALPDLQEKSHFNALAAFLKSPSKFRPDGRMPHFPLEQQEAFDLAAHLLDFQSSNPRDEADPIKPWPAPTKSQVIQGLELVQKLKCANCHDLPGETAAEIHAIQGTGGCLSENPGGSLPRYDLSPGQRESLKQFLGARERDQVPAEVTFAAMNCYACHERDGKGGPTAEANPYFVGEESLGDSGRLPPPLTGIGRKLKKDWLQGVLSGDEKNHVRTYLKTKMPGYPNQAEGLTKWLEDVDQANQMTAWPSNPGDLKAGKKLLGTQGGVNCITCHSWGEKPSLGIPALDISSLDKRLRPKWFHDYLLNPASYRPGTLMPPLWPGGQSSVPDVLEGNSERQIAAIWQFITEGQGAPPGFPDFRPGQFELIPEERPIIQRTFLKGAGTKAILVGFPGGINLAFDGLKGQPAMIWKGRFFDAYDTWFVRKIEFQSPAGEDIRRFPESKGEVRFRGYRTDKHGNPTFLLEENGRTIEETYEVVGTSLYRKVSWDSGGEPGLTHPEGFDATGVRGSNLVNFHYEWK